MKSKILFSCLLSLVLLFGIFATTPVYAYPSEEVKISVTTDKEFYKGGDILTISGTGAHSYSIWAKIISPSGEELIELSFVAPSSGEFSTVWIIPNYIDSGVYTVEVRDVVQTAQTSFEIPSKNVPPAPAKAESKVKIPDWIKNVATFWVEDQIDDDGFVQVIEYLIEQEIIVVPYAEEPEGGAASDIPVWIKTNAEFWVTGQISDDEFSMGLEWLINNGVIRVSSDAEESEGQKIEVEISDGIGTGDK